MEHDPITLTIGAGGELRLPPSVLECANLAEGSRVDITVGEDGLIEIAPQDMGDASEALLAGLREAREDVASGRADYFASDAEFREALVSRMKTS